MDDESGGARGESAVGVTNDGGGLTVRKDYDGPVLEFDLPGLEIGIAEYPEGPTGCTVFLFEPAAAVAMDIRGGSVGFVGDRGLAHGICLAGGSIYGLEAISGVAAELLARRGYTTHWDELALVSGAIVYDFHERESPAVYPDKALGRAAAQAARPGVFPLGRRGAGRNVNVGNGPTLDMAEWAGQGGAFRAIGATKLAVFTVLNAIGAVVDRDGRVVRGHLDQVSGERKHLHELVGREPEHGAQPAGTNTTLTVLVTNRTLDEYTLKQLGKQVHASMARAIQPFHTIYDGDVLFAATTNRVEEPGLDPIALGAIASEVAWDAVLRAVEV